MTFASFIEKLVLSGHAAWLGDEFPVQTPPPLKDVSRTVERIRAMFKPQASTGNSSDTSKDHKTLRHRHAKILVKRFTDNGLLVEIWRNRMRARESNISTGTTPVPRVWILMGHKSGDNAQVLTLAEALGWSFEIKRVVYRKTELLTNLVLGGNFFGVIKHKSSVFKPPWPDLVISAGRRNEPVCRWIQRQAEKRVRLVHIGRPWARLHRFDLIVTTPQYLLPVRPNILHNTTILHRVDESRLSKEAAHWAPRLAHLPTALHCCFDRRR